MPTGAHQGAEDIDLARKFVRRVTDRRAEAVLDFLYSVRINLFHGHKSFKTRTDGRYYGLPAFSLARIVDLVFTGSKADAPV